MILRSGAAILLLLAWQPPVWPVPPGAATHTSGGRDQVLILTTTGVSAYDEVLEGIQKTLHDKLAPNVIDLRQKNAAQEVADGLRLKTLRVVVTIGSQAAAVLPAQPNSQPIIATAVMSHLLSQEPALHGRTVTAVPIDVPVNSLLESVKHVFPGKSRLGVIHNSTLPEPNLEMLKAAAEAAGFTIHVGECAGPAHLLDTLLALKGQADLVMCFPDGALYNSATVKPLVLASLRYRLPLVAFSESFARAGAALSVYSDFREMGCETAELILKVLAGQPPARTGSPRRFKLAVNQNITRLLGLSYTEPAGLGDDFLVIR